MLRPVGSEVARMIADAWTCCETVSDARITGARAGGDRIPSWAAPSRGSGSLVDDAAVQPTRPGVPLSGQRFRTVQPKDGTRQRTLTTDEVRRLLDGCPSRYRPL